MNIQTDIGGDRQKDRKTETQIERQNTEKLTDIKAERPTERNK
jgi:hypothetical protein